jgi:Na+/melibiose symporter-like transporter
MSLKTGTKLAYGVGQFSQGVKIAVFYWFLVFYYNQIQGLEPGMVGLAAFLSLIADAISDPLIGQISDNWRSKKWGRRHGFMAAAALPFGLSIYFLFNPPQSFGSTGLFWWMLGWAISVRTFMTMFYVPHLSLGAELSPDYDERTSIAGYRTFFSYFGNFMFIAIGLLAILSPAKGGMLYAPGYQWIGIWGGVLATSAVLLSTLGTIHTIPFLKKQAGEVRHWWTAFTELFLLLRLRTFRYYALALTVYMASGGLGMTLTAYTAKFYWGFDETQMFLMAISVVISLLPAKLTADRLCHLLDKQKAAIVLFSIGISFGALAQTLRLFELMPANGTTLLFVLVVLLYVLNQALVIAGLIIAGSMIADMADECAVVSGKRQEGMFFAAYSFIEKSAFGLGTLFSGLALAAIHFPEGAVPGEVDPQTVWKLGFVVGPVYWMAAMLTPVCLLGYSLSRERLTKIQLSLES